MFHRHIPLTNIIIVITIIILIIIINHHFRYHHPFLFLFHFFLSFFFSWILTPATCSTHTTLPPTRLSQHRSVRVSARVPRASLHTRPVPTTLPTTLPTRPSGSPQNPHHTRHHTPSPLTRAHRPTRRRDGRSPHISVREEKEVR